MLSHTRPLRRALTLCAMLAVLALALPRASAQPSPDAPSTTSPPETTPPPPETTPPTETQDKPKAKPKKIRPWKRAWRKIKPKTKPRPYNLSELEWRLVKRGLKKHDLELMPEGEAAGKTLEGVVVFAEDVFTPDDLFPDILNVFHVTSKDHIIKQEVLLEVGEPYSERLVQETGRNLRRSTVLLVAQLVPVRGSTPDKVRLLVVTQDLWSLRTNLNFLFVGDTLNFLSVSLSEANLVGRQKYVALTSLLEQDTLTLGLAYSDPRIWGTRLTTRVRGGTILNRDTGNNEGFTGSLTFGKPLFALETKWGASLALSGLTNIGRVFVGSDLRTFDDPDTAETEVLPFVWRNRLLSAEALVVRSFGLGVKQNISAGYTVDYADFSYGESDAQRSASDAALVASFERTLLPRSEVTSGPFLQYTVFTADFLPLRNVNTFALPEDFRFGPQLTLRASHSDPAFGSSRRFQRGSASAVWRFFFGSREDAPSKNGDIFALQLSGETRLQDSDLQDNQVIAAVRNYAPVFFGGRFVARASLTWRQDDRQNRQSSLGSENALRGYVAGAFLGRSRVGGNVEWRTLPIDFYTLHLGGTLFYDVGGVSDREDLGDLLLYHGAGFGLRLLNPAANRIVFRLDWGFPLNAPNGQVWPGTFALGFEQAF